MDVHTTLVRTCIPVTAQSNPEMPESGMDGHTISDHSSGTDVHTITSLTTPCLVCEPVAALDAPLVPAASVNPETNGSGTKIGGIEISPNTRIDDWDGLPPSEQAVGAYIAAWENLILTEAAAA